MADQQSIELLPFNFTSRTIAYRKLAQGLSRSLSAFVSAICKYLDPVIKADQFAQNVDNIGIAANTPEQLIKNLRAVFQCLRKAGLKLSMAKCHFGVQEVDFLGRTITTKGVAPQKQKITKFLGKFKFPRSKKALQKYIGFLNYYRNYISRLAQRLTPFFQLLKATDAKTKKPITTDIMKDFREINKALDRCCQMALHQPLPAKQLVLMTDASFQAAGYAVLIEDDPNQKYTSTRNTYAPIAYGSKTYRPPSDPLGEIGFGRPFLDHLYNSHFLRASERICPRVFKLSVSLISVTSVREKPKNPKPHLPAGWNMVAAEDHPPNDHYQTTL